MSTRILSIALLLLFACSLSSAESERHIPSKRIGPCCVNFANGDISRDVTGNTYHKAPNKYPCVDAIIFTTRYGDTCADPNLEWVKNLIANMTQV